VLAGASAFLLACGTTSGLQRPEGSEAQKPLSDYTRVVVQDFLFEGAPFRGTPAGDQMPAIDFPDMIASELLLAGCGDVKRQGSVDAETLVIRGDVTRYEEGDPGLRFLIGFGAGMSNFDAVVEFRDGGSDELLSTLTVDRNSWPLGGAIAATQDPGGFMRAAARRVVDELLKAIDE